MAFPYHGLTYEHAPQPNSSDTDRLNHRPVDRPKPDLCKVDNQSKTLLCKAIEIGALDQLEQYLEHIKSNPATYPRRKVISLIASYRGKIKGMEMPLLIRAVTEKNLDILKILFETLEHYGLDACKQVFFLKFGDNKHTLIHKAVASENFEIVAYLINQYKYIETKTAQLSSLEEVLNLGTGNKRGTDKETVLDLAFEEHLHYNNPKSLKILEYLLEYMDPWPQIQSKHKSALHIAADRGNSELLKSMINAIRKGSEARNHCKDEETVSKIVNLLDGHRRTLLHYAVLGKVVLNKADERSKLHTVEYLMELGASCTCFDMHGISPLFIAIGLNDLHMVQLLLDPKFPGNASLKSNINYQNRNKLTPLNLAVSCKSKLPFAASQALKEVLKYNLDILDIKVNQTLLHKAPEAEIKKVNPQIIRELLRAGADPYIPSIFGQTLLHQAAATGNADSVELLLSARADPYIPDIFGQTPLHQAATTGNADSVELLLSAGGNPCIPDKSGQTPLHQAAEKGKTDPVALLLKSGANPLVEDLKGDTPLDVALKAILVKPPIEHDQKNMIKTLALILDRAIIQKQPLDQAVDGKRYESDIPNLFKQIESICQHGDHRCQRDPFNQLLNFFLLKPYRISAEITSQCKSKKRPFDFSVSYSSLNKKRKRGSLAKFNDSSLPSTNSGGQSVGT